MKKAIFCMLMLSAVISNAQQSWGGGTSIAWPITKYDTTYGEWVPLDTLGKVCKCEPDWVYDTLGWGKLIVKESRESTESQIAEQRIDRKTGIRQYRTIEIKEVKEYEPLTEYEKVLESFGQYVPRREKKKTFSFGSFDGSLLTPVSQYNGSIISN